MKWSFVSLRLRMAWPAGRANRPCESKPSGGFGQCLWTAWPSWCPGLANGVGCRPNPFRQGHKGQMGNVFVATFAAWTRERAGETRGQQKDLLQKALGKLRHDGHTESLATWSWHCYYLDVFGHFFVDNFAIFCIISNSLDRQWSTQNVSQTFYRFQTAMNQ